MKLYENPTVEVIKYDMLENIAITNGGALSTEPGVGGEDGEDFSL
ncbi:MAG: hypothetical protein ACI4DS_01265 [Eubacterium sp.]